MSVLPKCIDRFNAIPIKIASSYFVDISKLILKLKDLLDTGLPQIFRCKIGNHNKAKCNKIKNFCSLKDNVKRMRKVGESQKIPKTGRKYLQKIHLIKHSYPKYTKTF